MQELLPLLEADEAVFKYSWYETRSNKINQVIENRDESYRISIYISINICAIRISGLG